MTGERALSEHESKLLLASHGVAVNRERLVDTADEAVVAAEEIGYPVVLKLCGEALLHKTEVGAVRLGLRSPDAVAAAAVDLTRLATPDTRLLVAEQLAGNRELIIGVTDDPQFGPTVMLGIGGVLAEAIADVSFRLLPADQNELATMIDDLSAQDLLDPFRGEPAVDRVSLAQTLAAVAACVAADDGIAAIDVNPLIVTDGRPVAVDALVVLK
jgi:acetate---CoA ligase (ADP-forming) subunit beta